MFDLIWGALDAVEPALNAATLVGVTWGLWQRSRDQRRVAVVATHREDRKVVARIPARAVTRAEVLGLVAQAAGGGRLDFSSFDFSYDFGNEVVVPLPQESFTLLR